MSTTSGVNGKFNQLRFAEACCEVAQMDLSEFFEVWGFFEPMNNAHVGDYQDYYVTLSAEDAEASRARMQQYEKKGGHLIFIDDRIKPSKRSDGVDGYRAAYEESVPIGSVGSTGQWEDYMDTDVKAQGYFYKKGSSYVSILSEEGANGALGFKLYDAETGELLSVSNKASLKIPVKAMNAKLRIVAAQADGSDVELQDIAHGDSEEMQLETLNSVLSIAKTILGTSTAGREIGYFYADALTVLSGLYDSAKVAADNHDTSVHSYKEWTAMLNNEIDRLMNDITARAYPKELDVYKITNVGIKAYQLCNSGNGLIANKQGSGVAAITSKSKRWLFESTGELHHYYIKDQNGLYINSCSIGSTTMCNGTDQSEAVVFKANYLNDGRMYFSTLDGGAYLTLNSEYKVVCASELIDNSMWTVIRLEANNTDIEEIFDEVKGENGKVKTIYDLQGRKVDTPSTGIYIINGKKVLVK